MSKIIIFILSICLIQTNCLLFGDKTVITATTSKLTTTSTTTAKIDIYGIFRPTSGVINNNQTQVSVKPVSTISPAVVKPTLKNINQILMWSESDVTKWSKEHNFSFYISKNLQGFNGAYLHELYTYLKNSPEVFYLLIKQTSVDMVSFMDFSVELKKLFSI
jgi:hypothetical protein